MLNNIINSTIEAIGTMTIIAGVPALCVWLIYKFLLKEDKKESSKNGK